MIYDVNIDRIVISNRVCFGKKGFQYFVGYENDYERVMPLHIMLSKLSGYRRNIDETKCMSFLIKEDELLKIWKKVSKKEFYGEPVYYEKYLKTKIKSYEEKINTNVHSDEMAKMLSLYLLS